jgi:hypothetical protein
MVFRRTGARTFAFQARLPNGRYKQLQTTAPLTAAGKALASRIEAMWTSLAFEHRAWDLLEPVLTASRGERAQRLGRLYDLWVATKYNPAAMRRLLTDVDVEPLVASFEAWYRQHVRPDTVAHAVAHVRALLPVGSPCSVARITPRVARSGARRLSRHAEHQAPGALALVALLRLLQHGLRAL